jgi:hypothetical protein
MSPFKLLSLAKEVITPSLPSCLEIIQHYQHVNSSFHISNLHIVWFKGMWKERLLMDGKHANRNIFRRLFQWNNERGKKVAVGPT